MSNRLCLLAVAVALAGCQCDDDLAFVPGNLRGQVCHPESGQGLPGAAVTIEGPGGSRRSVADQQGGYAFSRVPVGTYMLTAVLGSVTRSFEVVVKSQETAVLNDTACRPPAIDPDAGDLEGQICNRHTGRLITDSEVILETSNGELLITRTDQNGNFLLPGVPQGEHVVTIRGEGFQRAFLVEIRPGQVTTLDLADGCTPPSASEGGIVGRFCNPATSGNLVGARVVVSPLDAAGETAEDITDTDGQFLVNGLPPGLYRVDVTHNDFSFTETQVEVEAGQFATVTDPSSCGDRPDFGRIEGEICDDQAGGQFVGTIDLISGVSVVRTTNSDSQGRFQLNAIEPGTYTVRASRQGYTRTFPGIVVEPFRTAFIQEFNCPQPQDVCSEIVNDPSVTSDGRILLVVDKSGSMNERDQSGQTKWPIMRNALINITQALNATVEFGLMLFPQDDQCGAGSLRVAVGANKADQIRNILNNTSPAGGTPTQATMALARQVVQPLAADGRPIAVVLATDGAPNCSSGRIETQRSGICRCTNAGDQGNCPLSSCLDVETDGAGPITEIGRIRDLGIRTFVIGVPGVEGFEDVLNGMAVAGGTDRPSATKFYPANNQAELQASLDAITRRVLACRVDVGSSLADTSSIQVRVGDQVLTRDASRTNGWDVTGASSIELFGSACELASAAGAQPVVVQTCYPP
jgi:hypothetical protein